MQSQEKLPGILWAVLIAGGVITVTAACFFGVPNFRFHLLQVMVLSFLIALVLVAIADIDRPYQGDVKVSPSGFEFALHTFAVESQ
jgi:ABC-type branched-subunit amino acid transport system permease subunit